MQENRGYIYLIIIFLTNVIIIIFNFFILFNKPPCDTIGEMPITLYTHIEDLLDPNVSPAL